MTMWAVGVDRFRTCWPGRLAKEDGGRKAKEVLRCLGLGTQTY
jgi:hypothetical protein